MNDEERATMCESLRSVQARFENVPAGMHQLQLAIDIVYGRDRDLLDTHGSRCELGNQAMIRTAKGLEQFFGGCIGVACNPVVGLVDGTTHSVVRQDRLYSSFRFGFGNKLEEATAAYELFASCGAAAWRCLPADVRQALSCPDYIVPGQQSSESENWVAALFAISWQDDGPAGLRANRFLRLSSQSTYDIESIIRLPTDARKKGGLPDTPMQSYQLDEVRRFIAEMNPKAALDLVEIPPPCFSAVLQPGAFLASAFAIQYIIRAFGNAANSQPGTPQTLPPSTSLPPPLPTPSSPPTLSLLSPSPPLPQAGAARPEFRRAGKLWYMALGGDAVPVGHRKGLCDIQTLLRTPKRRFGALQLFDAPPPSTDAATDKDAIETGLINTSGAVSRQDAASSQDLKALRERLADIKDQLESPICIHTPKELDQLRSERDSIIDYLSTSLGRRQGPRALGGGDRAARAQRAVDKRIREAIQHIRAHEGLNLLADHLDSTIRWEGLTVQYRPEREIVWEF